MPSIRIDRPDESAPRFGATEEVVVSGRPVQAPVPESAPKLDEAPNGGRYLTESGLLVDADGKSIADKD